MAHCEVSDEGTVTKFYWNVLIGFIIKNAKVNVCKTVNNIIYLNQKYSKSTFGQVWDIMPLTVCYTQTVYVHLRKSTMKHCMPYQTLLPIHSSLTNLWNCIYWHRVFVL